MGGVCWQLTQRQLRPRGGGGAGRAVPPAAAAVPCRKACMRSAEPKRCLLARAQTPHADAICKLPHQSPKLNWPAHLLPSRLRRRLSCSPVSAAASSSTCCSRACSAARVARTSWMRCDCVCWLHGWLATSALSNQAPRASRARLGCAAVVYQWLHCAWWHPWLCILVLCGIESVEIAWSQHRTQLEFYRLTCGMLTWAKLEIHFARYTALLFAKYPAHARSQHTRLTSLMQHAHLGEACVDGGGRADDGRGQLLEHRLDLHTQPACVCACACACAPRRVALRFFHLTPDAGRGM